MKLLSLFATILFSTFTAFSQSNFEPGYIIQPDGTKVDCLIKNEDWKGSPRTFIYKLDKDGEQKIGNISNVLAFGSDNSFKYIVTTVEIDQSRNNLNYLSDDRNPLMKQETLFLKTLVEGKASLYFTLLDNVPRYFYSLDDGEITQLIYKRYMTPSNQMGKNEYYKQQLATNLKCEGISEKRIENLLYKHNSMTNFISDYNQCKDSETIVFEKEKRKGKFQLTIRPGLTFSSFSYERIGGKTVDFDSNTGIRIGLEAEYILPYNNGKWSIIVEPTYRSYKTEKEIEYVKMLTFSKFAHVEVNYTSIEFPIGGRHYMFLNQNSAIFLDAAVLLDISLLDSQITSDVDAYNFNVKSNTALAFGLGFRFKEKYSVEARYHTSRQLLNYTNFTSSFNSFSLIAGYSFL